MKKLGFYTLIIAIIMCLNFYQDHYLAEVFNADIINYYAYSNTTNKINLPNLHITENGTGEILKTDAANAIQLCSKVVGFAGECVEIKVTNIEYIIKKLNLKVINTEELSNKTIITGYSNMLYDYVIDNGNKINVQVAIGENTILIGYPLILHSF